MAISGVYNFTTLIYKQAGLKPSSKVTLAGYKQQNDLPIYQPGIISKLNLVLWIMPEYNYNISFCWKSITGKIVKPTDEDFDETDVECWIEGLKPAEYWAYAGTEKKQHPFSSLTLSFDVFDFGVNMNLRLYASASKYDLIVDNLNKTISAFNETSEGKDRKDGVVHNWAWQKEQNYINLSIDTGSAGLLIIKKILMQLKVKIEISKVEIDL